MNEGRFAQRLSLIESRQVRLERDVKQVELQMNGFGEQLAHRPLKTDVIAAIAQQELAVEACASREALEKLEAAVGTCASAASVSSLEETTRASVEKVTPPHRSAIPWLNTEPDWLRMLAVLTRCVPS
jgi:hypothetical protein